MCYLFCLSSADIKCLTNLYANLLIILHQNCLANLYANYDSVVFILKVDFFRYR